MSTSKAKRPRHSAPGAPPLDRPTIVRSALALIDEEGLENFSLRNLSARLGVYPTALYWYVPTRNDLMAQIVALVLDSVQPVAKRRAWQNYLRDLFQNYRAAVRAHPNVAPLIGTQLVANINMDLAFVEQLLKALARSGLTGLALVAGYNSVVASLVGFIAQEFAPMPSDDPTAWQISVQQRLLAIDRTEYPTVAENLPLLSNRAFILRWQNGAEAPLDASFAAFVEVVISGLEALVAKTVQT